MQLRRIHGQKKNTHMGQTNPTMTQNAIRTSIHPSQGVSPSGSQPLINAHIQKRTPPSPMLLRGDQSFYS